MYEIRFPHLGIVLNNVPDGFSIGGFEIRFYGIVIALGFILGYLLIAREAKRTNQDSEMYLDYMLWLVVPAILGARIYYVLFSLDDYIKEGQSLKDTIFGMLNIRGGGLAIYGGVIAGIITLLIFAHKRKVNTMLMLDTCAMGLLVGQILGRWGNFFNREAFGGYTDSLFAMAIPVEWFGGKNFLLSSVNHGIITQEMIDQVQVIGGKEFLQMHPTFLYESAWNLVVLLVIFLYRRYKTFDGELFAMYIWGYGLGRVWIEGLRTDSLMFMGMDFKVSQLLAALCVVAASVYIIYERMKLSRQPKQEEE
ncbi:MAG: prolipoprotein diacylglyceryl transferase [Bacteroidales bacterium]|nr:prolipoprotein diacylglyceryl transferase [Clostridium sp.]MCM1202534.1 prolipoprotein diacylglyceryl transferase [Bacteroidales bacterium]